ncbi:MAG: type III pantothenate kinase [Opitutaceae bacterium]|nr:type III pantothenate kinase [Opitutaceae bacterium]
MPCFCIDIGNTHTHFGIVPNQGKVVPLRISTRFIDHPTEGIIPAFWREISAKGPVTGISFCSVVPAATPLLRRTFELQRIDVPVFNLTHRSRLGVPITYPSPAEIGQDRLANAAGAHALFGTPAVVIDLGTAVTFDVVTSTRGYEGGVIAPGIEIMRSYLHEKTAQLPLLDEGVELTGMIGKSTMEAMRIGTVVGFAGLIQSLLTAIVAELQQRGEPNPQILSTGGTATRISGRIRPEPVHVPDLTLQGLAAAFRLNHPAHT